MARRPWKSTTRDRLRDVSFRTLVVFAVATFVAMIPPALAWAAITDNIVPIQYGAQGQAGCGDLGLTVCRTDSAAVYYYMDSGGGDQLESGDRAEVRDDVMATDYGPTDLSIHYDSTPKWSGSGETDIYYQEEDLDADSDGTTWCNDEVSDYRCDQQYIAIDPGHYNEGLICHETGHAVGLVHGDDAWPYVDPADNDLDCMQDPVPTWQDLGDNSEDNIDAVY